LTNESAVPTWNATDAFAGIVKVRAVVSAEGCKRCLPASLSTIGYATEGEFCGTLGACHVAVVLDVAVRTCPTAGAAPADTSTDVVADFRASVSADRAVYKLATSVVDVTARGAVPVATVEVSCPDTERLVPVAAPITGVVSVGDVAKTSAPVPVSSVTAAIRLALDGVAKNAATLVPRPVTPPTGSVQFVNVPDVGVPRTGVTNVGDVANTSDPVPVSSVTAAIRFALDGVAKNAATPVPSPVTPPTGSVQFVNVPDVGVPRTGVVNAGLVLNTKLPEPVSSVIAAIRFALDGVAKNAATPVPSPVTPVVTGSPVQLVNVPEVGVPRTGVTNVGDVLRTGEPVPVAAVHTGSAAAPPPTRISVVPPTARVWCGPVAVVPAAIKAYAVVLVERPVPPSTTSRSVVSASDVAVAAPRTGVTSVGDVAKTLAPVPVSSVNAAAKFALDGVARNAATLVPRPVTPPTGSVQFVNVPDVGVPRTGVTSVGDVAKTLAPVPVSSVNAVARLALDGVAKNAAMPVPSPEMPVATGSPVFPAKVTPVIEPPVIATEFAACVAIVPSPRLVLEVAALSKPSRLPSLAREFVAPKAVHRNWMYVMPSGFVPTTDG
jgi:hypothetical protein